MVGSGRDACSGPALMAFPLDASRGGRRAHAHRNLIYEWKPERTVRYRPTVPNWIPWAILMDLVQQAVAVLGQTELGAVAFWIDRARASEPLGMRHCDVYPGEQAHQRGPQGLVAVQQLPAASADAFVWHLVVPAGPAAAGVPRAAGGSRPVDATWPPAATRCEKYCSH